MWIIVIAYGIRSHYYYYLFCSVTKSTFITFSMNNDLVTIQDKGWFKSWFCSHCVSLFGSVTGPEIYSKMTTKVSKWPRVNYSTKECNKKKRRQSIHLKWIWHLVHLPMHFHDKLDKSTKGLSFIYIFFLCLIFRCVAKINLPIDPLPCS